MEKKTFVWYSDWYEYLSEMDDAQAGVLFKTIVNYVNGKALWELDTLTKVVFAKIKKQLDKDHENYLEVCAKRKEAIQKRWGKKKWIQKNTNVYKWIQKDYDTDTDTDTDYSSIYIWSSEQKEIIWKLYPHSRKGKKQDALKEMIKHDQRIVLQQVKLYKREVNTGLQDAKYVPWAHLWFRDFVPYSETIANQKKKQMYKKLLEEKNIEKIKEFTDDFWNDCILQMYNEIQEEKRKHLLSWWQK